MSQALKTLIDMNNAKTSRLAPFIVDLLDNRLHRTDEDRWLASRFALEHERIGLIALYALEYELYRAVHHTSEIALGRIRLQWWREALDEIYQGCTPRQHDVTLAIAWTIAVFTLPHSLLEHIISAYESTLESHAQGYPETDDGAPLFWPLKTQIMNAPYGSGFQPAIESLETEYHTLCSGGIARLTKAEWRTHFKALPDKLWPVIAHFTLIPLYQRTPEPGPLAKRWQMICHSLFR